MSSIELDIGNVIYYGSLLLGLGISWAKTNSKIEANAREVEILKEIVTKEIKAEKELMLSSIAELNKNITTGFKRIDEIKERVTGLETKTVTLMDKDTAYEKHPTREELKDKLEALHNDDISLKEQVTELKKDIQKKLNNLDSKFEDVREMLIQHAKEEGSQLTKIHELLLKKS